MTRPPDGPDRTSRRSSRLGLSARAQRRSELPGPPDTLISTRQGQGQRQREVGDLGDVEEPDAYLSGHLAPWFLHHGRPVPTWVLLNQAAHGTVEELRAVACRTESSVERTLARAVLGRVSTQAELTALQIELLLPLESSIASAFTTRRRLVEMVGRSLYD